MALFSPLVQILWGACPPPCPSPLSTPLDKFIYRTTVINKLKSYCDQWGLEVSIKSDQTSKTAIMIFNNADRQLNENYTFNYEDIDIPSVKTYTYLGIIFTLSGSLKNTQQVLIQKGLRLMSLLWNEKIY